MTTAAEQTASKAQAMRILARWGITIDESASSLTRHCPTICLDAPDRMSFSGDCRGLREYSHNLPRLWRAVIERANDEGPHLTPCPLPLGQCEFHDSTGA